MGQDSKRKRFLRRVKRERTQLRQAVSYQQQQLETVVKMLMETQEELRALKPMPSYTIETLPDASDNVLPTNLTEGNSNV